MNGPYHGSLPRYAGAPSRALGASVPSGGRAGTDHRDATPAGGRAVRAPPPAPAILVGVDPRQGPPDASPDELAQLAERRPAIIAAVEASSAAARRPIRALFVGSGKADDHKCLSSHTVPRRC